jgi:hypothetical protein
MIPTEIYWKIKKSTIYILVEKYIKSVFCSAARLLWVDPIHGVLPVKHFEK